MALRIPSGVVDQYAYFVAVDITDLKTRETGLTTFTVYRSRNGGASAVMTTPTINETDTTNMPGVYELLLDEDMTLDAGDHSQAMVFHITQASMAPVTLEIEIFRPDVTAGSTHAVDASGNGAADVIEWLGTAAATPTVAGVPEVDVTHWIGTAAATPTVAGVPEVDLTHVAGSTTSVSVLASNVATLIADIGGVATAAADGDPTSTDLLFAYIKQLINILVGSAGIVTWPASAAPGNAVSIAEALRAIHDFAAPPTAAAIADAVLDEDMTAHQTLGTLGQAIGDPVADTNTIYKAVVTDATGATVGVDVVAVKADTAAILVDTGTTLDGRIPAALVGGKMDSVADVTAISGDATAADNLESEYDGTGYGQVLQRTTIATLTSQTSFTLTAGSADNDAYNGCIIVIQDAATAAQKAVGVVGDYTGATKTVTMLNDPAVFTMAATDIVTIIADRALKATVDNRTLDVSATGEGGLDWANIGSPTTAQNLSATNIDVDQVVASVSGAVGSVTGAVGSVTGAVGSVAAGGITAASIATNAIDADALAADAVAEIQAGLATPTNITAGVITTVTNLTNAPTAGDLTATMKASVNAELVDVVATDTLTLPGQAAPPLAPTHREVLGWLFKLIRNRQTQTSTQWSLMADNETTVDAKATVSDDGTTAIRQEVVSGP